MHDIEEIDLRPKPTTHTCKKCKQEVQITLYGKKAQNFYCNDCSLGPTKKNNASYIVNTVVHGLSTKQYYDLFIEQNGRCLICKETSPKKKLAVDHCHKTNKVRGLLCQSCNIALGLFKDNTTVLMNAVEYLSKDYSNAHNYGERS